MQDKVMNPGVIGLTNYRNAFVHPIYGTVMYGDRSGHPATRAARYMRRNPQGYYVPNPYPGFRTAVAAYTPGRTRTKKKKQYKKKTCCKYIRGKKRCRPEYCAKKKKYWY